MLLSSFFLEKASQIAQAANCPHFRISAKTDAASIQRVFQHVLRGVSEISQSEPIMKGWLEKRGGGTSIMGSTAFRKRYFVLRVTDSIATLTYQDGATDTAQIKVSEKQQEEKKTMMMKRSIEGFLSYIFFLILLASLSLSLSLSLFSLLLCKQGTINLKETTILDDQCDNGRGFMLEYNSRKYSLRAIDAKTQNEWLAALRPVCMS